MPELNIVCGIILTTCPYLFFRKLYLKYKHPFINVVLLSASLVITILLITKVPYKAYIPAKNFMTYLLGPATVGLAVPLFRQRKILQQYFFTIVACVGIGSMVSISIAGLTASLGKLPREVVISILPKGVTIPFAVEIAGINGGVPALASAFVIATGTLGSVFGGSLLTFFGISSPIARGLALGTAAHGQGTAMAFVEGEQQGAMAGLAMTLAGIITAALVPLVVAIAP
ncbi:LrgB family protein [Geomonas subterranea]|uniref:LrgB family protein n=1 Tax=Geomonas subterranea TaxID=2847989 RepID=A0ABX8LLA1_9BACT|nr:LrgB family protein [Geomonas subterranea]QXE92662.1 LrgB family protein [Geomonas subterranea]QXM09239.1 LrgB family protein [Geomonas subterranea]